MKASDVCIELIKGFESLHDGDLTKIGLQPKMCPAGYWTEGYGHLITDYRGVGLKGLQNKEAAYALAKVKTEEDATNLLAKDVALYDILIPKLGLKLEQHQYDALVSFCFNCGYNSFVNSTLYRYIKQGKSQTDIYNAFLMWVKGPNGVLPGLVRRRKSEAILFNTGVLNFFE